LFADAADCYEQLVQLYPDVNEYNLYYAQSLYKACDYQEAMKVSCQLEQEDYQTKVMWGANWETSLCVLAGNQVAIIYQIC
jgi:hypothetical protein